MHPSSLSTAYRNLLDSQALQPDVVQETALARLLELEQRVTHWQNYKNSSFFYRLFYRQNAPQGIYLYGPVGRGKSMLADLFYAQIAVAKKRRVHFHAFMVDVHARVHEIRQRISESGNPIKLVAKALAREAELLYLDELQVHDVADAMILSQLFTDLFDAGVVVIATSNRAPEELYRQGLQRERFLKFVALVSARMDVVALESPTDYRLQQIQALEKTYLSPLGPATSRAMEDILGRFSNMPQRETLALEVQGRTLAIRTIDAKIACCSFEELCARPLGAADYLAIARQFEVLALSDVPVLTSEKRNEAKRFVTLIDTLYEHKVKLITTADAPPRALYPAGEGTFEFERTISRLMEMQSERYLGTSHLT